MRLFGPALVLLVLLGAPGVQAEDEPAEPPPAVGAEEKARRVAAWLEDLRSKDFQVRETARTKLRESGLEAREVLEAAKDDPDPEVRRTVRAILSRASAQATQTPASVRPGDFGGLGRLSLGLEDEPLSSVLPVLSRAVGGRIEAPQDLLETAITLQAREAPCFDVLQQLAQRTGTWLPEPFDRSGHIALVRAESGAVPVPRAAAGPMQVRVMEVSATRTFGNPAPPRYALKVQLEWAPLVQLVQYERPRVEVARDPDGKAYRPTAAMSRSMSYGVGGNSSHHATTIHVEPAESDCRPVLGVLELSVPIRTLRFDQAVVEVSDFDALPACLGADGKPAEAGSEESVQIHAVEAGEDDARGQWVVDFSATLREEAAQRSLQAWLVEPDGSLRRVNVYGGRSIGADGTLRITGRSFRGSSPGTPKALRITWFRREEQGLLRFRLQDIPLR